MESLLLRLCFFMTLFGHLRALQAGSDACLQIYSVPKQTIICEPSEEVRKELDDIQETIQTHTESMTAMNIRIDDIDPDQPKDLPDDVLKTLAEFDILKEAQQNQSKYLSVLQIHLQQLQGQLGDMETNSRREFDTVVALQTDLISAMWHQSNLTLHEEYVDRLNATITQFTLELQLLELKLRGILTEKESQLLSQLEESARLARLEMDSMQRQYTEQLRVYTNQLENALMEQMEHMNLTIMHGHSLEELALKIENLSLKQTITEEHQATQNEKLEDLLNQLEEERQQSVRLQTSLASLETKHEDMIKKLDNCKSEVTSMADDVKFVRGTVERWQHITPRTLKVHDCQDALRFYLPISGVYAVSPGPALQPIEVYCDMADDQGWTVIQSRQNGSVDFFRGWEEYRSGFGDPASEYWIGLQSLHVITNSKKYRMRIDLQDWQGKWWFAEYSSFVVDNELNNYTLHVGDYKGNAGDSLSYHNDMPFTTMDRNNDQKDGLCATWCHGAWWYKDCYYSNLNGRYYNQGPYVPDTNWGDGISWKTTFNTYYYSFRTTAMKIIPID